MQGIFRTGFRRTVFSPETAPLSGLSSVALPKPSPMLFLTGFRRTVFGPFLGAFPRAVPLRFAVLRGSLRGFVLGLAQACSLVLCPRPVALPKHSLLTIPCHPNRRGSAAFWALARSIYNVHTLRRTGGLLFPSSTSVNAGASEAGGEHATSPGCWKASKELPVRGLELKLRHTAGSLS